MKFYCENCGTEVGDSESCPTCGFSFAAVRCPECGTTGAAELFKNGCPNCGYKPQNGRSKKSSAPDKNTKNSKIAAKSPPPQNMLPIWVYVLSAAVLLLAAAAVVALNFSAE